MEKSSRKPYRADGVTQYHNVPASGGGGGTVPAKRCTNIEGRIQSRKYQGKDGMERTAYDIIAKMLGGRQDNPQGKVPAPPTAKPITSEQYRAASGGSTRRQPAPVTPASDIDDDIPY